MRLRFTMSACVWVGVAALGAAPAWAKVFITTGGLQTYIVPTTGLYVITAVGGDGGNSSGNAAPSTLGGLGAEVGGQFALTAGTQLTVLVGGRGVSGLGNTGGGGGGASYVAVLNTPLIIAGGGGGGGISGDGTAAGGLMTIGGGGGAGGTSTSIGAGGGGGGFVGNGTAGATGVTTSGGGGFSYLNGGAAGTAGSGNNGGFGGGGGSGTFSGGGGGGYTGGNGGNFIAATSTGLGGFGGTSFDAGQFPSYGLDSTLLDGLVVITPQIPEPAALGLIAAATGLLARRRRLTPCAGH